MAKQGRFKRKQSYKSKRQYKTKAPLMKMEKKGIDIDIGDSTALIPLIPTAMVYVLNLIQEGTGSYNRIGRKVALDSIRVRLRWTCNIKQDVTTPATIPQNLMRFVLVWDRQPGNTVPSWDEVFQGITQNSSTVVTVLSMAKYSAMSRFTILRDHVVTARSQASAISPANHYNATGVWDEYVKLGKRECTYKGTANPLTIASINSGALYLMAAASMTTPNAAAFISDESVARLRYFD